MRDDRTDRAVWRAEIWVIVWWKTIWTFLRIGERVHYSSRTETQAPAPTVDLGQASHRTSRQALFECLIVAHVDQRGGMLKQAALDGGWDPLVCRDAEVAAEQGARRRFRLALLDLQYAPGPAIPRLRRLSESLSAQAGPLVIVCGHENDPPEEIWARQLGVWLYWPAVDETCDIASVCRQALIGVPAEQGDRSRDAESGRTGT